MPSKTEFPKKVGGSPSENSWAPMIELTLFLVSALISSRSPNLCANKSSSASGVPLVKSKYSEVVIIFITLSTTEINAVS